MQHLNNYLLSLHSLELNAVIEDGQAFLSLEYYDDSTKFEVELERMRLLAVNELIGLDEVKLQYQINNFGLIYNKFITHFDYQTNRKYLLWLVQKEEPARFGEIEEDENIQLFIKNRVEPNDIASTWEEILLWAETFLHIERDMTDIPYKVKSVRKFYYIIDNRIRVSIASLDKLIFDVETITNKKPALFKTIEQIRQEHEKLKNQRSSSFQYNLTHHLNPSQIKALYKALINNQYISDDTAIEHFQALFDYKATESIIPIVWCSGKGDLVYLFEKLQLMGKIHMAETIQAKLKRWFVDLEKKPLINLKQAKQTYLNSKSGQPASADNLNAIITSLFK